MSEYVIRQVQSVGEFLKYWTQAMVDTHWFKEQIPFHYTRKEMIEEITKEFAELGNLYLVAKSKDAKEILGVLRVKIKENIGTLGRWEPAVPFRYRNTKVGEALIQKAFSWLRENNVRKVKCMLRYPFDRPETGHWHKILYEKCGFRQKGPPGIMLLAELSKIKFSHFEVENLRFIDGDKVPIEKFADFVQKAYTSTAEDQAIHGFDPYVSKREENLKVLQAMKSGKFGFSPPEFWKVALVRNETVGFVKGFMPRSKYRPAHGVIADIGVFPEFRRKGIAYALISEIHECFKKYGCKYSYVGTPKTNHPAIRLYQKAGYKPVFELINFEKTLATPHSFAKQ
ncbi:MAG: GNAT family N-acetyltransferase [Candidatus Bathyarchaeia archaeon]